MHSILVLAALGAGYWLRWAWASANATGREGRTWCDRWHRAMMAFLLPPLLLIMTAIAISLMGPSGQMVGCWEGWLSYGLAILFLAEAELWCLQLGWQGWRTVQRIRCYPTHGVYDRQHQYQPCRIVETSLLYSAQIGFWQPDLVISRGMLETLTPTQLVAVVTHEQAHTHYRDTLCFFWLGWLRRVTSWLPYTDLLWQELLMLRELRADSWAAQRVDALVLAEVLLAVVQSPWQPMEDCSACFGEAMAGDRLTERVNALLTMPVPDPDPAPDRWFWLGWLLLPLLTVPFHV